MALDIQRVRHIVGSGERSSRVAIIGMGSGGFPLFQHLVMSGWSKFLVVDPDGLDEVNLVKHPGLREQLNLKKVDIALSWARDRNPDIDVWCVGDEVSRVDPSLIQACDVVVCAVDDNGSRHYVNDVCLQLGKLMTLGLVHRGGTGGTVLVVRPGATGCYACLETVAAGLDGLPSDNDLPITEDETDMIYGRGHQEYSAAGLSADIALVSALHAQATMSELVQIEGGTSSHLRPFAGNWLAISIRSDAGWSWDVTQLELPKIEGCGSCGGSIA